MKHIVLFLLNVLLGVSISVAFAANKEAFDYQGGKMDGRIFVESCFVDIEIHGDKDSAAAALFYQLPGEGNRGHSNPASIHKRSDIAGVVCSKAKTPEGGDRFLCNITMSLNTNRRVWYTDFEREDDPYNPFLGKYKGDQFYRSEFQGCFDETKLDDSNKN